MINIIQFLFLMVISYLGLLVGNLLIFFAPEELEPGRKYLKNFFYILFSTTFFVALYLANVNLYISLGISSIIYFLILFLFSHNKQVPKLIYPSLGILFGISSMNSIVMMSTAGMVFLTGIAYGSISIKNYKEKNWKHWNKFLLYVKKILLENLGFILCSVVSFVVISFFF
jgi:hypothetical protein